MSSLIVVNCVAMLTGVVNEHSSAEYVPLEPLGFIVEDVLLVLKLHQVH